MLLCVVFKASFRLCREPGTNDLQIVTLSSIQSITPSRGERASQGPGETKKHFFSVDLSWGPCGDTVIFWGTVRRELMKGPTPISETVLMKAQSKERHLSVTCPHAQHLEGREAGAGWCETSERGDRNGAAEPEALVPWASFHLAVLGLRQFCPHGTFDCVCVCVDSCDLTWRGCYWCLTSRESGALLSTLQCQGRPPQQGNLLLFQSLSPVQLLRSHGL